MGDLLFFKSPVNSQLSDDVLPHGYRWELWAPSPASAFPEGLHRIQYLAWLIFHHFRIFANRDYRIFMIRNADGRIVHRSIVTPRYFRFPFMKTKDLQIGDVWTDPDQRGKGLALFAIRKILVACGSADRFFWYLVEQENLSSIRVAEKAGLELGGRGAKRSRFGIALLGYYYIAQP